MPNPSRRLEGRVAIVTGASRGIGHAISKKFAEEGAKLALNYNASQKEVEELQREIKSMGGDSIVVQGDVSKQSDVARVIESSVKSFGRIDVLVNNAGIIFRKKILESVEEEWDRTIDVNVKSVYLLTKAVAPIMIKQGKGKIVNISSISGLNGPLSAIEIPDYAASKAAVVGLTKSLALNLAPTINVNVVCPGATETDMFSKMSQEAKTLRIAETPLGRFGKPVEVANAVLFLASDESDFVTGETIVVSGGRGML